MASSDDLVRDPGVLAPVPVLEFFGWSGVREFGGLAVLPHRREWKEAVGARVDAVSLPDRIEGEEFQQAVVHLQKGRAATQQGLNAAWRHLETGGRLLLVGANELGVKSAVKRLAAELQQSAQIVANRARARVVAFSKADSAGPALPQVSGFRVTTPGDAFAVHSAVGVFSADGVDRGTQLLLDHLDFVDAPHSILDLGCGLGLLGLAALRRWPTSSAIMADVDRRAVAAAERNAAELALTERSRVVWWDATSELPPVAQSDLVLLNPPFHAGKAVDLDPPRAMFRAIEQVLAPGGSALIVANRTLPYERELRGIGRLRPVAERDGFKLLALTR